jgi:hypothetical protein
LAGWLIDAAAGLGEAGAVPIHHSSWGFELSKKGADDRDIRPVIVGSSPQLEVWVLSPRMEVDVAQEANDGCQTGAHKEQEPNELAMLIVFTVMRISPRGDSSFKETMNARVSKIKDHLVAGHLDLSVEGRKTSAKRPAFSSLSATLIFSSLTIFFSWSFRPPSSLASFLAARIVPNIFEARRPFPPPRTSLSISKVEMSEQARRLT